MGPFNVDFTMSWDFPYEEGLNDTNNQMYQAYSQIITDALIRVLGHTTAVAETDDAGRHTAWIFSRTSTGSGLNVFGKNVVVHIVTGISDLQKQLKDVVDASVVPGLMSISVKPAGRYFLSIRKNNNCTTH